MNLRPEVNTPTLIIDEKKAMNNIRRMAKKATNANLKLRPHFKTHQSQIVGKWFKEEGITGITVSSLKMAKYFAEDGWEDITIAFPVNLLEYEGLNVLASKIKLNVLGFDKQTLALLDEKLTSELGIYIELDPGYGRSGVPIDETEMLLELKAVIKKSKYLRFEGFYTHAGHSYKCRSEEQIRALSEPIIEKLKKLKAEFGDPVCFGDTPSCSVLENFEGIDQINPGNFVFYDWTQVNIGSCTSDQIAVAMYCPIVAKFDERKELLIHGGAVHFSKDSYSQTGSAPYFGVVATYEESGWGAPIPDVILKSISQEHGIISCTPEYFNSVEVGDLVPILPIHSCLTADLMGHYRTLNGALIDHMNQKSFQG